MKKIILLICSLAYMLICTLSANAQWQQTTCPGGGGIYQLVSDATNIFAVTADSGIFLSNNNGIKWAAVNNSLIDLEIVSLVISGTNVFVGTYVGGVFLSTNSGTSWTAVNKGLTDTAVLSMAVSGTNIFAGTATGGVFLSGNNGSTWTAMNNGLPQYSSIFSLTASGSNIFAMTGDSGVYFSNNNGSTWSNVNNGLSTSYVTSIAISGNNIFAATTANGVYLSTNNGGLWTPVNNGLLPHSANAFEINDNNIFVGLAYGVYLSKNNGILWTDVSDGLPIYNTLPIPVYSLTTSGTNIFAGSDTGVWKRSLSDILAVENISSDINDFNIYPNPATNQLTIHASSFQNEAVTVSIMNVLGQNASPPAPLQRRGEDASIDVSKLAAGMYFLKLKSESGSVVKKFVKE